MAIRNAEEPLIRVTLNVYEADYKRLREMYPNNYTTFLRQLLRNYLQKISAQAVAASKELDVSLE